MIPLLANLRAAPDPESAKRSYARLAERYDASCRWLAGMRFEALEVLGASEGETVIDMGCGTGAMLPALGRAVGRHGRVFGFEQCGEMAAVARERVERAGLTNVRVVDSPAEQAEIEGRADALLFFYTHDILQSDEALERACAMCLPGARIVVAGARLLGWWAAPLNLWKLWRVRNYLSTYEGLRDPPAKLARRCRDWIVVSTRSMGTSYLAYARYDPHGAQAYRELLRFRRRTSCEPRIDLQ